MFNNKERKMARLEQFVSADQEISESKYNMVLGGAILYGLIMNVIIVALFKDIFLAMNPIAFIIGYFISCIAGTIISAKSNSPVVSFLGYNLIVIPIGGLLSCCLQGVEGIDIFSAMLATSIIVLIMVAASIAKPDFFAGLGKTLCICLILSIVVEIALLLMGIGTGFMDFIVVIIFALYIGYDYHKAQEYPKTADNAIDSAIDIYLDIINIFIRLLSIMSKDD